MAENGMPLGMTGEKVDLKKTSFDCKKLPTKEKKSLTQSICVIVNDAIDEIDLHWRTCREVERRIETFRNDIRKVLENCLVEFGGFLRMDISIAKSHVGRIFSDFVGEFEEQLVMLDQFLLGLTKSSYNWRFSLKDMKPRWS